MNVACYHPSMHIIIYITLNMYSTEIQDFTNQYTTHQLHNLVLYVYVYVCVCVCVCVSGLPLCFSGVMLLNP